MLDDEVDVVDVVDVVDETMLVDATLEVFGQRLPLRVVPLVPLVVSRMPLLVGPLVPVVVDGAIVLDMTELLVNAVADEVLRLVVGLTETAPSCTVVEAVMVVVVVFALWLIQVVVLVLLDPLSEKRFVVNSTVLLLVLPVLVLVVLLSRCVLSRCVLPVPVVPAAGACVVWMRVVCAPWLVPIVVVNVIAKTVVCAP